MEGMTGIEPASLVWKTKALPLSYIPAVTGDQAARLRVITVPDRVPARRIDACFRGAIPVMRRGLEGSHPLG